MSAQRDVMTLDGTAAAVLGVEERSDEALSANMSETPTPLGISVGRWR